MGDLQLIGQGRQAEVFAWGDTKVLKLFAPGYDVALIEGEACASQAVHEFGVPTPGTHGVIEVEGRHGIVYDRAFGKSMMEVLNAKPWKLSAFGRMLAELHASVHEFSVDQLPSQHEQLEHLIARAELPVPQRNLALARLRKLPEAKSVCHGDFHPGNVLVDGTAATIIDWTTACAGNPVADFARTSLIIQLGAPPPSFSLWTRILMHVGRGLFHRSYTRRYQKIRRLNSRDVQSWMLPIAVARLGFNIMEERDQLLALIEQLAK